MSSIVEKQVAVVVKNFIGEKRFAFFTSKQHGDVFVHENDLVANGFRADDMVVGYSAVIDIKVVDGKQRTARIYEINCQPSRPARQSRPKSSRVKNGKPKVRKLPFYAGVESSGYVKVVKDQGFGFIEKDGHEDIFFPMRGITLDLAPFIKKGVQVKFTVEDCDRGVLARITDIIWAESQIMRQQVDCNKELGLFVSRDTYPTKQNKLEVRDVEGNLVSEPATLTEAREQIGKTTVSPVVDTRVQSEQRQAS